MKITFFAKFAEMERRKERDRKWVHLAFGGGGYGGVRETEFSEYF